MPWSAATNLRGPKGSVDTVPAGAYGGGWSDTAPSRPEGKEVTGTPAIVTDITQPIMTPVGCSLSAGVVTVAQSGVWSLQASVQYNANAATRAVYFVVGTNPTSTPKYGLMGLPGADSLITAATVTLQAGQKVALCTQLWSGSGLYVWKTGGCTIRVTWLGDPQNVAVTPSRPLVATLTDAPVIATDAFAADTFRVTVAGDRTIGPPSMPTDGQRAIWQVTASGAARMVRLAEGPGAFDFGTTVTTLSPVAAGTTDHIGAVYHAPDDRWHVLAYTKGY